MIDLIKTLILDFQHELLEDISRLTGIARRTRIVPVEGKATYVWV